MVSTSNATFSRKGTRTMKKNLRSIIFASAISTVGALGLAGAVAVPAASGAVVFSGGSGASTSDTATTVTPQSHTATPPAPTVTEVSTSPTTSKGIDKGFDVLALEQW
jgi:hypothetical protein